MIDTVPRVLLVEDEEGAAEVLATVLELEGFKVTVAPNGRRALEILEQVQPAVIITDYMMPMMDGIEMTRAIRAIPTYRAVPILMMSGVAESSMKEHESLLSAFLRKPFKIDALVDCLRRLLGDQNSSA